MKQKRHTFLWFGVIILMLAMAAGMGYFVLNDSKQTLVQTAENQLISLKKGNYSRAYYLYTSDNYQQQHSLDEFRAFVKAHPILIENENAEFFGDNIKGDYATLSGELQTRQGSLVPIIYRMIKEYGEWKIDSIQTMENQTALQLEGRPAVSSEDHENELIAKVVQGHLLDLKYRNVRQAYEKYLADEFKKTVPFSDFEAIVKENPDLTEFDSIRFGNINEDDGLRHLILSLISDEEVQDIQFWLAKDRGQWKIWAIEVGGPTATEYYEVGENDIEMNASRQQAPANDAVKVINQQLQDLKKGDVAKAYRDYVSQEFTKATSIDDFEKFITNYPEFTNFTSYNVENQSESDGLTHIQLILTTGKGKSHVDYWLAKQDGNWKIWGIRVDESAYYPPISDEEKNDLVTVIKEQLKALKDQDLSKAYYAFSSQDFQNNTSFEDFEQFLKDYPIFTDQNEATIGHGIEEGDLRLIRIALQSQDETAEVDYRLINQDGDWKIWGIQILTNVQDTPENEDEIKSIINSQINALQIDDVSKAYYAYTSKQFQESASFDAFQKYVSRHDELGKNEKAIVGDINFKPTYASAVVYLEGPNGNEQTYIYRLVNENNQWKILSIKMVRGEEEVRKNHDPLLISKVDIGTEIDLNGLVTDPKDVFSTQDKEITVNVHVINGAPGDQLEAVLEHVKTSSSIPPVVAKLDKPGESMVSYVFTAPTQGWPAGVYRLHFSSPTGLSKTIEFDIKK